MRYSRFLQFVLISILSVSVFASDIPAEARAVILKQQIMDAMKASPPDTNMALDKIAEYRKLKLPMPPPLLFMEGKLAVSTDDPLRAAEALEAYFKLASPDDERYAEAAKMYASVEAEAAPLKKAKRAEQKRQVRIAAERQAQKKAQAEAQAEAERVQCLQDTFCRSRLRDMGDGVLLQPATGLEWTQSDSGRAIELGEAKSWCASKGSRLPSVDEFNSIIDTSGQSSTSCGSYACKVSPLLHLNSDCYWHDVEGESTTGCVQLVNGSQRRIYLVGDPTLIYALCVREGETKERTEAQRQAKLQTEREACVKNPVCLVDAGGGVLRQPATGLEWTQSDNKRSMKWDEAKSWCSSKGDGWRLPLGNELQSLYDISGKVNTYCGGQSCKVSPLLIVTGFVYWGSAERLVGNVPSAEVFSFNDGLLGGMFKSFPLSSQRALCVRGP